ncbi:SDR family oxidoreductase [Marinomonas ostreistagni]|uniref:SDR family oxidoreductase n=1 Tax=Marinomonas ostreistagni TaxID=359209 RepID=A0ABS0ZBY9_9GAMM|nr:SDR family oxidoreductase [Marinomonas ostreistagni]MBJ7551170.1 SDR family oxidoreductase [Marinomonas ostreistagni]
MIIQDSHIVLIGATGGIGQATALELARRGARLTLVSRHLDALNELKNTLPNPEQHTVMAIDITSKVDLASLSEHIQAHGKADALINNAGANHFSMLSQKQAKEVEHDVQLNLIAPMLICQSAFSWLNQPGIMLNIGSTFGSIGYPGYTSYCAAKAGLQRFTEALDRELHTTGIRVLYLAPRATDTALNSHAVIEMNQKLGNRTDSPLVVAEHIVMMLEQEISAKWIGWPEKLFARINQIFPSIVSSAIRKQHATIQNFINRTSH